MARKARELMDGASYHVMNQINRGEYYFQDPELKEIFLGLVKEAKQKFNCVIRNFCIMNNHVHMDIFPRENNLSGTMQWLFSMFARAYNAHTNSTGRVWRGRFKSKIITDQKYQFNLFEYISNNPVRVNLAKKIGEYKYCGLYHILNKNFEIVDPPDQDMMSFIDHLVIKAEKTDYVKKQKEKNHELGFYPKKPGRKPAELNSS